MGMKLNPELEAKVLELAGLSPCPALPDGISEASFRHETIRTARMLGWKVAAIRPVRVQRANGEVYYETPMEADGAGWPDLVCVRDEQMVVMEQKVGRNKPTAAQLDWLGALRGVRSVWADEVRPSDWKAIQQMLGRRV